MAKNHLPDTEISNPSFMNYFLPCLPPIGHIWFFLDVSQPSLF